MSNPLIDAFDGPFGLPPFAEIAPAQFREAFEAGFAETRAAIAAICAQEDAPGFSNTLEALERSGALLERVAGIFFNIANTDSDAELEALDREYTPKFAELSAEISMNSALFARIDAIWQQRDSADLSPEQLRLLEVTRSRFIRAGAQLAPEKQARLATILSRLAGLGTDFTQNVMADERAWTLTVTPEDLQGCPPDVLEGAKLAAEERGESGMIITLSYALIESVLTYADSAALREKVYRAWKARGNGDAPTRTEAIVREMLALRQERAELLGYENFAALKLETEMARNSENVESLLHQVWAPAKKAAEKDAEKLAALKAESGDNAPLQPWDWAYYANILRQQEHDLDSAALKPYLPLEGMLDAIFDVAKRLFNLDFTEISLPLYNPDARIWEVRREGQHMGLYIGDFFARAGKRSGAWCSTFRAQSKLDGDVRPIVLNVCNFAKGEPALCTWDNAVTLFHEFGHALHNLLSDVTYDSLSGTSVARDFVELPSQLLEHWLTVPEVLQKHARHAETGAAIPAEMIAKIKAADSFDQGFATVEYLASALVDMGFHTSEPGQDPLLHQANILEQIGMPAAIRMRHETPHFQHVFAGDGYAAGYYSYMWSETMDADAFAAFEAAGDAFDPALAKALEEEILSKGNSRPADEAYLAFRGKMPDATALLKGRGLA